MKDLIMRRHGRIAIWIIAAFAGLAGCGGYKGVAPEGGYDTGKVVYEKGPKPHGDATILQVPLFHPKHPETVIKWNDPPLLTKSKPIAFVGEVELFDDRTDSALLRFELSPILADGKLGMPQKNEMWASWIKGEERIAYRLDCLAPSEVGRYHVAVKSIGPALDVHELDTFVEGEIQVR